MKKFQSKSFIKSASHAFDGLYLAFRSQRNFRKHLYIASADAYYKNKYSRLVKFAKDMGAASVLLMAVTSMIAAFFILGDRIYQYYMGLG